MKKIQTRMLPSLAVVVFSRFFLTVGSQTGQVLPPQNISLLWTNDFEPEVTWAPPQHSVENCTYEVISKTNSREFYFRDLPSPPWKSFVVMEGGFLQVSVQTVCGGRRSEPTVLKVSYPEIVKNVQCSVRSSTLAHFSWETDIPIKAVHFFYRLVQENLSTDDSPPPDLQECPLYRYTEESGISCDLQVDLKQSILVVFKVSANKVPFRNTFRWLLIEQVTPPPLKWTVKKTRRIFLISWIPPDIKPLFEKYIINYTECNQIKYKTITDVEETSTELEQLSHCQYRIAMKAQYEEINSPWGAVEHFDADTDPNAWVYAVVVIIPLLGAALATLACVCCWKNKNHIFPKVPQPRDLLTDILDNNNKSAVYNRYVATEEDVNCKITLVTEPHINAPDC